MNKVIASLLMIGVVAAMAGAGTFAFFSSEATSVDNTFTAGTLNIGIDTSDTWVAPAGNMQPGDTVTLHGNVSNDGSLPLDYTITTALSGNLSEGVYHCNVTDVKIGDVSTEDGYLGVGESDDIYINITMPSNAGNEYQGQSGMLNVTVTAAQQSE